ncbi:phosphotransferase [Bacillus sp. 31A1R]|uniref:Phosphotransferase n=1 Tax=Robertmurraya mangrovi TaxID=3098077 RepID=A0ABU5J3X3_9BACI|nr:phosphotransferase [Bacillus sp. 31A1R]MDZ5474133.1 phosphotransferase [Bacillus sp. 31A1R]
MMGTSPVDPINRLLEKYNRIAEKAVEFYSFLKMPSIKLINYSENATYLVTDSQSTKKYILRVGRPGYHTKKEVESELEWLKSINQLSAITISLPLQGENGEKVQTIVYERQTFYCTLFTFLEGNAPDEGNEQELIHQFEILGEVTANLHEHSIKFRNQLQQITRLTWDYDTILGSTPKWGRWQHGLGMTEEKLELFEEVSGKIKERLNQFGKSPERFGLIHSDLRLANLLVENNHIKIIDFDDCGFGWYLYDLATSISFMEHKPYVPLLIQSWLKGYRKVRPLSKEEEYEIPTFIMMRRLQLVAWVGSRDNETTRELGSQYTEDTVLLAEKYLEQF